MTCDSPWREVMQRAQTRIAHLRRWNRIFFSIQKVAKAWSIMHSTQGEHANARLPQLRQARRYKTPVLLVGMHCIKQITCLHKQINTLAYREICRLLKSVTQTLPQFLTLPRVLARDGIAKMVIGSQHNRDDVICLFLLMIGSLLFHFLFHVLCSGVSTSITGV